MVNMGFNVQTAVEDDPGTGTPLWLAVLTGLFAAGAATALLRGVVRRNANS